MDTVTQVQILDGAACILRNSNAPGKGIYSIVFLPAMGEYYGRLDSLTLV